MLKKIKNDFNDLPTFIKICFGVGAVFVLCTIGLSFMPERTTTNDTVAFEEEKLVSIEIGAEASFPIPYNNVYRLRYCGIINNSTFVLSETNYSSVNIFYPLTTKEIKIHLNETILHLQVISVDPEKIVLKPIE